MTAPLERLPRASYRELAVYRPQRDGVVVDLSDNTNQWGAPPSAAAALAAIDINELAQYPSQPTIALQQLLADYACTGDAETIVTGCGSDDLLDCLMRALAEPGDTLVHAMPTFTMSRYYARANGVNVVGVPLQEDWDIDVDRMLSGNPRIVYVCAPNNPTGTGVRRESIERLLREANGLVVIDEAYSEFGGESWARDAINSDRLLVLRTMSKAFGLAGLRVGYGIGSPPIVHEMEKARGPYKLTVVSERIAMSALANDVPWVKQCAAEAIRMRQWLREALLARGFAPLPSEANFLLVPTGEAAAIADRARQNGVLVRFFPALPIVGDALRITVAPQPYLERFVDVLDGVGS